MKIVEGELQEFMVVLEAEKQVPLGTIVAHKGCVEFIQNFACHKIHLLFDF